MNPPCHVRGPLALTGGALLLLAALTPARAAAPAPLQTFTVKEYLQHQWTDEIVHFPISYTGQTPSSHTVVDETGKPVPCQVTGLARKGGRVTGTVWAVVTLPAQGQLTLRLQGGKPPATGLRLVAQGQAYVLSNEFLALRLPKLPGAPTRPTPLASVPAPLLGLAGPAAKDWLGAGRWVSPDPALQVKQAVTSVVEQGPVRVTVRYRLTFTDGKYYQADVSLGARQDCALFTDDTDVEAPQAGFRFSLQPGLQADRLYWRNNFWRETTKGLQPDAISFEQEHVITRLCPWSFWWLEDRTGWAGWYREGGEPFVGVIALRPSRWSPWDWDGFDRTAVPLTARPGGQLDMTLGLLAMTRKQADGTSTFTPLHRELAFTVGSAAEHVTKEDTHAKLRLQLLKYSQFPLDEVKEYGLGYKPAHPEGKHPFLLIRQEDVERTRRLAKTVPVMQEALAKAVTYIAGSGVDLVAKINSGPDGWERFYRENYVGNYLYAAAPTAYLASEDPKYGLILAAGVKGMARELVEDALEAPSRADLGGLAHMYPSQWARLLLAYDALAASGYLTAEEKRDLDAALVFGAHLIDHPDYWNNERGLCSANPNMTSLIRLPLGLLSLFLQGHPDSAAWLSAAEKQLQEQIADWITPGGAWVEDPGYQAASLDGMFMLSEVLKNVQGKDYFAEPALRETMDYYGFLLTPPDVRFARGTPAGQSCWMVLPSIGDMWSGTATVFNGWMAKATAKSAPAFSARQEFYWRGHGSLYALTGAASSLEGWTLALVDPDLPATPPAELARAFPGFGSILRTSWTEPRASYVAHRTGPNAHHYHDEYNEIVYYAKGAPLCTDFGNLYVPLRRDESWYHNRVSFNKGDSAQKWGGTGELVEMRSLPRTVDYSYGKSQGGGGQVDHRHLLLVKSADPLGANYVVMRDRTGDGQPNQQFFYNLWCLSKSPEVAGAVVHFPGQFGVDLDLHVLSPAQPQFEQDHWDWKQYIGVWGNFTEEQYGVRVMKQGSGEDFLTLLYPRAAGQAAAQVTALAAGAAVQVGHMEGTDLLLLAPGKPATVETGEMHLAGEIAFARRYVGGDLRLAVVSGAEAEARLGEWALRSSGPVALEVKGGIVTGESSGARHVAVIGLPAGFGPVEVRLDGKPAPQVTRAGDTLTFELPEGNHVFGVERK